MLVRNLLGTSAVLGVLAFALGSAKPHAGTPQETGLGQLVVEPDPQAGEPGEGPSTLTRVYVTMLPLPFDAYVERAQLIAVAQLTPLRVVNHEGTVSTVYSAQIQDIWKGPVVTEVQVLVGGGRLGSHVVVVEGAPEFKPDESVVLFLKYLEESGTWGILGLSQGTLRVRQGSAGERTVEGRFAVDRPRLEDMRERVLSLIR
jgi:hypothetical protein